MADKIFLLPPDGPLVVETIDDESALVREPVTKSRYCARLVEAVPDDWSDVSGSLDSTDPAAAWDTGYEFHRSASDVRIVARRRWTAGGEFFRAVQRPDLAGLLIEGRAPGFVLFHNTGYDGDLQFLVARSLAASFVRRGYRGWLSVNNGRGREYSHKMPAQVCFHLSPWSLLVDVSAPRRTVPPTVVLSWDERYGGSLEQLEPVHAICRRALREWVGDLGNLGEVTPA